MSLQDKVLGNKYLLGGSFIAVGGFILAGVLELADASVQATGVGTVALVAAGATALAAKYLGKKDEAPKA